MKLSVMSRIQSLLNIGVASKFRKVRETSACYSSPDRILFVDVYEDPKEERAEYDGPSDELVFSLYTEKFLKDLERMDDYVLVNRKYLVELLQNMTSDIVAVSATGGNPLRIRGDIEDEDEEDHRFVFGAIAPIYDDTPLDDRSVYSK